jgi:hypothetical protein
MSSKAIKISIGLLCLLALAVPPHSTSAAGETPTPSTAMPPADPFVSTEANPTNLQIGETALVSVKLNNVPIEGHKSAEFTCTYNTGLVEKSNITVTDLFGVDPVTAIHDPQNGTFIVAIAGANSNRATTSGTAFTFSVKALQAGQSPIQCAARVSKGDNVPIELPSTVTSLTILGTESSPTPFVPATSTSGEHAHPTATSTVFESPTPLPTGSLSGQVLASKPVTVHLFDANQVEIASVLVNPDGTFLLTPLPGDYTLDTTASGFLSYQGSVTITPGNPTVFPPVSLLAGDIDGNDVIDQFDALTIGMSYTSSTPEAADLNNDTVINFLDLELLAENYRQTGPTTGVSSPILSLLEKIKPTAIGSPIPGLIKTLIPPVATSSPMPGPKPTVIISSTIQATGPRADGGPYPDAPLCPTHDPTIWHGLWDSARGCHYDHEHGTSPFTPEAAAMFPGFDLRAMLCGMEIGHCVPSGPMEHTHKHGGFKWNVLLGHPHGCEGHEGSTIGVDSSVIEYHAFGDYSIEFGTRIHSAVAMMRQCKVENPTDYGYVFIDQHVDYGQRVSPYQGLMMPYADNPFPSYDSPSAPYFTIDCIYCGSKTDTRQAILDVNENASSTWTSEPRQLVGSGSHLFEILFRVRDTYQVLDRRDLEFPYTFVWLCSNDDGLTYAAQPGCRYNNSTTAVHEVNGTIPAAWDNLPGFDTNPTIGRITADGYVTHFGELNLTCVTPGTDCHPIKLVNAFVGYYGSFLLAGKEDQFTSVGNPERDIYFCAGVPCTETSPGAISSGWIGAEN